MKIRVRYLHVMSRTLFAVVADLSLSLAPIVVGANIEERLPLIFEKSADMGRYWARRW